MSVLDRFRRSEKRSAPGDPLMSLDQWANFFSFQGVGYPFGQLGLNQTLQGTTEEVESTFAGYVRAAYQQNGVIFACMLARLLLFSEARFQFQRMNDSRPGDLFGTQDLAILETPWPNGTTGDLLKRMIQDTDLAGNFYAYRKSPTQLKRMQPDWVTIVLGSMSDPEVEAGDLDAEVVGYIYHPGGRNSGKPSVPLLREQVAHWAPIPDPTATYRGMSWLTPILREVMADGAATAHKLKFFENAATPNLAVSLSADIKPEAFERFVELMEQGHTGVLNAYKTLYLAGGAAVEKVGADFRQMDFKVTQGAGETRIAAAAGVPPIIVGLSEGLQSATYSNYGQARRRFADGTMRPLWRDASDSLAPIINVPGGARLWYDDRDVPFLYEDAQDRANITQTQATAIRFLVDAGFEPDSVIKAVQANDMSLLSHTGLLSVQLMPPGTGKKEGLWDTAPSTDGKNALRDALGEDSRLREVLDESKGNRYLRELLAPLLNGNGGSD